ncbi:MAG: hypothetical protein JSS66_08720 [Armatimonadetes bacterium]|nr:hypothetical protein [Armatimonadota bacterium]
MTRNITKALALAIGGQIIFGTVSPALADVDRVAPVQLDVQLGRVLSGDVKSLDVVDLNALVIQQFLVPNRFSDRVSFTVAGHTHNTNPTAFSFTTFAAQLSPGDFNQAIDLFDFHSSSWVSAYDGPMTLAYSPAEAIGTGDLSRFVNSMGMVVTRVRVRQLGPSGALLPSFAWDMGNWVVAQ